MPWVEEELQHKTFLDEMWWKVLRRFTDKSGNFWWQNFNDDVEKVDLYRITFEKGLLGLKNGAYIPARGRKGKVCVTRHVIMKRWDGELLGLAQTTNAVEVNTKDMPRTPQGLYQWFVTLYGDSVDYSTLYAYTMDKYEGYTHSVDENGNPIPVTVITSDGGMGVVKASLDIEYYNEYEFFKDTMQSPITQIRLRQYLENEEVQILQGKFYRNNTNWWDDSLIRVKGVIDEYSFFFTLQADAAPSWEDNKVTKVPLFFGNLTNKEEDGRRKELADTQSPDSKSNVPVALFGGAQTEKFFNLDDVEETTETLQPIARNYVSRPSNGCDSIMVKKTRYGARYQSHYLQWNSPAHDMAPSRENIRLALEEFLTLTPEVKYHLDVPLEKTGNTIVAGTRVLNNKGEFVGTKNVSDMFEHCTHILIDDKELVEVVRVQNIGKDYADILVKRLEGYLNRYWRRWSTLKGYTKDQVDLITRKYPRAWNNLRFGYYNYDFNSSRYSDKVHTSRAYVVHPEDGVVGRLPNSIVTPLINLFDGDYLKFKYNCVDCAEEVYDPEVPPEPTIVTWSPVPVATSTDTNSTSCSTFNAATTVEEAEKFCVECLKATPSNYSMSLEWANYFNEGVWKLIQGYPSMKTAIESNGLVLHLDPDTNAGNTLGYFEPPSNGTPMKIAMMSARTVAEYSTLITDSFATGFLASSDHFHLINHEMGHFVHYSSVGATRWGELTAIDSDGYGTGTPLTSTELTLIETELGEYAHHWYPIELIAEAFGVFTSGYGVSPSIMDLYTQYDGVIPQETSKTEIETNTSRPT